MLANDHVDLVVVHLALHGIVVLALLLVVVLLLDFLRLSTMTNDAAYVLHVRIHFFLLIGRCLSLFHQL